MPTKVVFIGAGSFVFGPTMLSQAIVEGQLPNLELVLVDPNEEIRELMANLGRRMAESVGLAIDITTADTFDSALAGADFVISCAAVQMNARFATDRRIIEENYPAHLITEFGGVAGVASTLRQLALVHQIASAMKRECPDAWLLDVANPLPRVCQMAHEVGVKTAGFCSVSISGFGKLWEILQNETISYPFTAATEAFEVQMGGTNHLSWLVALRDRATGTDLLPKLRSRIEERVGWVRSKSEVWARKTGYLPMSGDHHTQDFLPPEGLEHSLEISSHGSDSDRKIRLQTLKDAAAGTGPWQALTEKESWERPFDFIRAIRGEGDATIRSLNLVNTGQIEALPRGAFVETAVAVDQNGPHPEALVLPESVIPFSLNAAQINMRLVQASQQKSLAHLDEVVELDPTVLDKELGRTTLRKCLTAHQDLIGSFS